VKKPFGEHAKLHHVGLVVASISKSAPECEIFEDPVQKVRVAFTQVQNLTLELVEPLGEDSPVRESLNKGSKLLHLCYETEGLDSVIASLKGSEFRCLAQPVPAVAFEGRRIAWTFHPTFGLIELLEKRSAAPAAGRTGSALRGRAGGSRARRG